MSTAALHAAGAPLSLEAQGASVSAGTQVLLPPTSIALEAGRLVAVIGPSGAGKTTLLRALAGVAGLREGRVWLGGEALWRRSTDVGYVPAGDLLHRELTVRETLVYAARLRLPAGSSAAQASGRAEEVLAELSIAEQADARVGALSTGQRRRVAVGIELVSRPAMLLLDEPTAGLDAGLERRLMRLLRGLADDGRGVLIATHDTTSLALCDEVAVMAPGGVLLTVGAPTAVLDGFGVERFEDVYEQLVLGAPRRPAPPAAPPPPAATSGAVATPRRTPRLGRQIGLVASRYARCVWRDRRTLAVLLGQAPIIGLAIGLVLPSGVLSSSSPAPFYGILVCFLLVTGAIWLGTVTSCRELTKERGIIARETLVGLRMDAYILGKCAVIFPLVAAEAVLLALVVLAVQPLGLDAVADVRVAGLCIVAAFGAATMGLVLSAVARSPDQATSSVPILLIPQLLFAGALIPIAQMPGVLRVVSELTVSHWALAALGGTVGLDTRLSPDVGAVTGVDPAFFGDHGGTPVGAIAVLALLSIAMAAVLFERRLDD